VSANRAEVRRVIIPRRREIRNINTTPLHALLSRRCWRGLSIATMLSMAKNWNIDRSRGHVSPCPPRRSVQPITCSPCALSCDYASWLRDDCVSHGTPGLITVTGHMLWRSLAEEILHRIIVYHTQRGDECFYTPRLGPTSVRPWKQRSAVPRFLIGWKFSNTFRTSNVGAHVRLLETHLF
jgi:hypothetical protein